MSSDLTAFGLTEMLRCSLGVRTAAAGADTVEGAAQQVVRYFRDALRSARDGTPQCVLARLYKTHAYAALDAPLRAFADRLLGDMPPPPALRCLCLLATAGDEPAWNDRRRSQGHQAIPLPSPEIVAQAPMVAQLVHQFGLDLADVVTPAPALLPAMVGRTYGVFHVEDAVGSPYIPAQREFVDRHGVRSVVGFGGALRSGDIFAVILFSRVTVRRDAADRFRNIALDVKSALFDLPEERTFADA